MVEADFHLDPDQALVQAFFVFNADQRPWGAQASTERLAAEAVAEALDLSREPGRRHHPSPGAYGVCWGHLFPTQWAGPKEPMAPRFGELLQRCAADRVILPWELVSRLQGGETPDFLPYVHGLSPVLMRDARTADSYLRVAQGDFYVGAALPGRPDRFGVTAAYLRLPRSVPPERRRRPPTPTPPLPAPPLTAAGDGWHTGT